jgi:hypothetical protein
MDANIDNMRSAVADLREKLLRAENKLNDAIHSCRHDWSSVVADHIYHPSYTIPGDPPGTMGIDWRGPTYVDAKTEKRWKRTCKTCGLVEYTSKVKEQVTEHPAFN